MNEQSMQGHTPLHMCAANGHVEVMQFVLNQKGCDANIQTKLGNTAVHLAGLPARGPSSTGKFRHSNFCISTRLPLLLFVSSLR